jgi:hypothetical protein
MNFVSDTWTYETSLTLPHFIEMPGEWAVMYMCAKGIHFAPFYNFSSTF